jgi:predicted alpha/beta hydrolase family esterase
MFAPDDRLATMSTAAETDFSELPLERLEHEITQLASHLQAGMCRWLELVAEFDRREGWGSWGCKSCADWVAWRCAVAPRAAREHVRVARALGDLPEIHAAFARGELSYSKVRALTRVATPEVESELVEMARHATAAQLERICRGLRRVTTDEALRANDDRYLTHWWDPEDGALCIHARIPAEDGALGCGIAGSCRPADRHEPRQEPAPAPDPAYPYG